MVAGWSNVAKKYAIICLEALLFLLNFAGRFSSGKTYTADCCLVSGSYWYTPVLSLVTMSKMRGDLPQSNFLSKSTLPRFCSSLSLWGTQRVQRFLISRQPCRMKVRLSYEIFMISCISSYVTFWSFLIRDSTLGTFSRVTVVAIRLQRSSSSNVLAQDLNCLSHLEIVTLDGD